MLWLSSTVAAYKEVVALLGGDLIIMVNCVKISKSYRINILSQVQSTKRVYVQCQSPFLEPQRILLRTQTRLP